MPVLVYNLCHVVSVVTINTTTAISTRYTARQAVGPGCEDTSLTTIGHVYSIDTEREYRYRCRHNNIDYLYLKAQLSRMTDMP